MAINFFSIVVPAYKQEKTIVSEINKLSKTLATLPFKSEIIIVIDGIVDKTQQELKKIKSKNIKVYSYEKNQGKGYAVRFGVSKAKGDMVGFIDADMEIDPEGISMLLNHMLWYDADIIVGSKLHPVSQVSYPVTRRFLSLGYRLFTHLLFGFRVRDTQVGLKIFKRKVARDVFKKLLVKHFAFDIELLAVAYALGYRRIYEAPIKLNFKNDSTIPGFRSKRFWKIIFNILGDTLGVFYRVRIMRYYSKR